MRPTIEVFEWEMFRKADRDLDAIGDSTMNDMPLFIFAHKRHNSGRELAGTR